MCLIIAFLVQCIPFFATYDTSEGQGPMLSSISTLRDQINPSPSTAAINCNSIALVLIMMRLRALGACLALAAAPSSKVHSDPTPNELRDLLERAKRQTEATKPRSSNTIDPSISTQQAIHARHILDKYYLLSAEALSANKKDPPGEPKTAPKKKSKRKPAREAFVDLDPAKIHGKFCKKYVIIGGGTAAWSAIDAIVGKDPQRAGDILLVSEEEARPYNRTVLSKELWVGDEEIEYGYKNVKHPAVQIMRNTKANSLDVVTREIILSNGHTVQYDKLLLATGGTPSDPTAVSTSLAKEGVREYVSVFRTIDDFKSLKGALKPDSDPVVIGGGFLGTELALSMTTVCRNVTLAIAEPGVLFRVLPRYLSEYLSRKLTQSGVKIIRSAVVSSAEPKNGGVKLQVDDLLLETENIVVAVGIEPETTLASMSGLEIDQKNGGIVVNDLLMAEPDVFAAGDVASFHDRQLGRRRVEHWDHAVVTGSIAGKNMVGGRERYNLQSMFWSDLGQINTQFTAVGLVDSRLETIGVWNLENRGIPGAPSVNEYRDGAVYYLRNGCVVGVVLWNPERGAGGLRRARALIEAGIKVEDMDMSILAGLVNLGPADHRTILKTNAAT